MIEGMVGIGLLIVLIALCGFWVFIKKIFGDIFATFLTIIVTAILILIANTWLGQPTEQELKHFNTQRRDKGR